MKKLSVFLVINCLFLAVYAQTTITIATGSQSPGISVCTPSRTFVKTDNGFRITYKFDKANINPDIFYPDAFEWSIDNFGTTHELAKPAIPIRKESYFIPEGKTISVSVSDIKYTELNMQLAPAKPMLLGEHNDNLTLSDVPQINNYSGFYPTQIVNVACSEFYRNSEFAYVNVFPIQYDMQNKKVRAYTEITFDVNFIEKTSPNRVRDNGGAEDNGYLPFDFSMPDPGEWGGYGNVEYIYTEKPSANKYIKYDYLVISTPELKNAVEKFCKWKRQLGYNMNVEYRDDWTAVSIKDSVYDVASTHPNFSHLLLFGSFDIVPGEYCTNYISSYGWFYSDLKYACLNGSDDYYPDLVYGRIPVSNITEANTVVDKIIKFESYPPIHDTFYNTATFTSPFYGNTIENFARYTETCETIRQRLNKLNYNTDFIYQSASNANPQYWHNGEPIDETLRKPLYMWNRDHNNISSAVNNGILSVLYRGHGNRNGWAGYTGNLYNKQHIATLSNDSLQPVIFSIACSTGRPGADDSFAEAFLKAPGGGCSAVIAATDDSYTLHNNHFADGMFDAIWPQNSSENPTYEIGRIMQMGLSVADHYYDFEGQYQRQIYHCFGDPSMKMYTKQPMEVPEVTVERKSNVLKVKVNGTKNMYISVYDPETDDVVLYYGTEYTKRYTVSINPPADRVIVTVYNDNYRPKVFKTRYFMMPDLPIIRPDIPVVSTLNSCEPTNDGQVRIKYSVASQPSSTQVIVSDIYGNRLIVSDCDISGDATIDISRLAKGIYIVSLYIDGNYIDAKRILKQ